MVTLAGLTTCVKVSQDAAGTTAPAATQVWELTFEDSGSAPHPQTIIVSVPPFTTSGTWGENSQSPGLWLYGPDGICKYQIRVGGNIVHDAGGDRWSTVNLGGAGCGMQTLGTCQLTSNGQFPQATTVSGTCTLTTESPLGSVTLTQRVTGHRR